jgi:hypothetical protein
MVELAWPHICEDALARDALRLPPARAAPAPAPLAGSPLLSLHNTCEIFEIKGTKNSEEIRYRVVFKKIVFHISKLMVAFTE